MTTAAIILVGTELLNGSTIDTNSIFIAEELNKHGIEIAHKMLVPDDMSAIIDSIKYSHEHADLIIISGGLGPTIDDFTKYAIGEYLGLEMVVDPAEYDEMVSKFSIKQNSILASNIKQVEKPKGAISFSNDVGMAPAIFIDGIAAFPGVPRELKNMLPKVLAWYCDKNNLNNDKIYIRDLLTFGIGESVLDDKLKSLFVAPEIHYEFLVKSHATLIRLQGFQHNRDSVDAIADEIYGVVGKNIFGEGEDTLESVLVTMLRERNLTLSMAESCTGGLLASKIVNVSGASAIFHKGFVTYSNSAKEECLGVSGETLAKYGAVSEETAREMVAGLQSDVGIAITGIAGPKSDDTLKPVGLVYIGVRIKDKISVKEYRLSSWWDRNRIRNHSAKQALFDTIQALKNHGGLS